MYPKYGADMWKQVTHLGGNSGGSYFGSLFMYSESFYRNVTGSSIPLKKIVDDYMHQHVQALADLADGKTKEFGSPHHLHLDEGCPSLNAIVPRAIQGIEGIAEFPYFKLLPYVAASILKNSINDVNTATYKTKNHTLAQTTLVQVAALPPDAWTSYDKSYGRTSRVALQATMTDGAVMDFSEGHGKALPVAFTSLNSAEHGWTYNKDIAKLSVVPQCPYEGPASHKSLNPFRRNTCKKAPFNPPTATELALPEHPLLAELTAASGAATGFAGSPMVYKRAADSLNSALPKALRPLLDPVLEQVQDCMPFGLQGMGPPMLSDGDNTVENSESMNKVLYRYLDGGYAENTAVPMTLAKAQSDCRDPVKSQTLDCSGDAPISLVLVNDGDHTALSTGFGNMSAGDPLHSLFHDSAKPVGSWVPGMWNLVDVPSPTIFAETFPGAEEWMPYNEVEATRVLKMDGGHLDFKKAPRNITSYVWSGVLTTVENKYYGVVGGQKVRALIFSLDIPGVIWPGLFNDKTEFDTPGQAQLVPGRLTSSQEEFLLGGHGRMAEAQHRAMLPHLEAFLAGSEHSADRSGLKHKTVFV